MTDPQPLDPQQLPAKWRREAVELKSNVQRLGSQHPELQDEMMTRATEKEICADELEAALASAAGGPSGWQPIETAPFDEDVIGYFPDASTEVMIVHRFGDSEDESAASAWYSQDVDVSPEPLDVQPTHWMPLPNPPAALRAQPTPEEQT